MSFSFVVDLNSKGAKSKPSIHKFSQFVDEIDISFDENIGDGCAPHYHYERIEGACIPYIDYDSFASEDRVAKIQLMLKSVRAVFGKDVKILLADRSGDSAKHGKYKLSLRAYIRGAGYFTCPQACGDFMVPKFRPLLGEGVDGNAYKANQNMGSLFNTKMGDPRILEPLDAKYERMSWSMKRSGILKRSLIQNVEGETKCLDPEGFVLAKNDSQTFMTVVSDVDVALNACEPIIGVIDACVKLMPGLIVRKVIEKGDSKVIEFHKCNDK